MEEMKESKATQESAEMQENGMPKVESTFEELGVSGEILRAIQEMGYVSPMPVQEKVIPYLLGHNNDVVALAQTGTGKTAAYGLPVLQKIDTSRNEVQAVIMAPTRELCLQITDDLKDYSKYINGLHVLAVYGGASIEPQIRALKKGVQVIVATPGRLVDLMERKVANLSTVENVVLDEADEMLNMGFSESIDTILAGVPAERNTLLFSATMSKEIERISKNYLHDAKEIVVGSRNEGAEHVNHIYYMVSARDKYNALKRVADYYPEIYAIIFCRTRMETQEIADKLIRDGYNAESLHGELSQAQRDLTGTTRPHHAEVPSAPHPTARGYRCGSTRTRCGRTHPRHQLWLARRHRELHPPFGTHRSCRTFRHIHLHHPCEGEGQGACHRTADSEEICAGHPAHWSGDMCQAAAEGD